MSYGLESDKENEDPNHIDIRNEFNMQRGENLPNHSTSIRGRGVFVKPMTTQHPIFRTKQSAYRFAAWLTFMADTLPDEVGEHTLEQITEAIRNK